MPSFLKVLVRETQQSLAYRGFVRTLTRLIAAPLYLVREHQSARKLIKDGPSDFDQKFGVDTGGKIRLSALDINSPNWVYGVLYQGTAQRVFYDSLSSLQINYADFTFIDFGSGKGRALLLASEFPFKSILGVEFSPELNTIAERNIHSYRSPTQLCRDLRSVCMDFASFHIPVDKVVLYLFNPCQEPVMAQVVRNIEASVKAHPREIYIIYCNPIVRHLFEDADFLTTLRETEHYCIYQSLIKPEKALSVLLQSAHRLGCG